MIVDLFAGPGGWSEGLRMVSADLHATEVGYEIDHAACATRNAAGHCTIQTDVATVNLSPLVNKVVGLIASPPCQDFSVAGKRAGIDGNRGQLITEVIRWAEGTNPQWIACEQVPPALPIWHDYAEHLETLGYSTWAGILNAADYGVPQTRRRAFLIATQHKTATPPLPTHDKNPQPTLFGTELHPWVSMAHALANRCQCLPPWAHHRPATTIVGSFRPDIVAGPGVDLTRPRQDRAGAINITITEALTLQSFPADYPVQGSKTKKFEQVGNAVPPRLAAHILAHITGHPYQPE